MRKGMLKGGRPKLHQPQTEAPHGPWPHRVGILILAQVEANIVNNCTPLRVGRAGTGVDIARAVCFLASDESVWITGQDWTIDGGMTIFDAPNKGWMADPKPTDPVPLRHKLSKL